MITNRVLITGAGGFIGNTLAAYLEHRGYDVTKFDINLGNSGMPDLMNQDIVIHLGANSNTTETDLPKILEQNFEYSVMMYEMCALYEIKFQYASSGSVYGTSKSFKETDFCKPLSPYAFSKIKRGTKQALFQNSLNKLNQVERLLFLRKARSIKEILFLSKMFAKCILECSIKMPLVFLM